MSSLYKVILVDDEDDVRGRIVSKITEDSGFEVVGKAGNGYDALELVEELKPHVVITDIRMPFIDGIELAKILRRDYPTIKVGFISGYDEFDYAREAIELNVISYLMKPITENDLSEFLLKLKYMLDREVASFRDVEMLQKKYDEALPKLKEASLFAFSNKTQLDEADLSYLQDIDIPSHLMNYQVGTIMYEEANLDLSNMVSIKSIIENTFSSFDLVLPFKNEDSISFLVGSNNIFDQNSNDLFYFEIIKYIEEYLGIEVTIGVSNVFFNFKEYPVSVMESLEASRQGQYNHLGQLIYYVDISNRETTVYDLDPSVIKEFEYAIRFKPLKDVKMILDRIQLDITKREQDSRVDYQAMIIAFANALIHFSHIRSDQEIHSFGDSILETLSSFQDTESLFSWILDTVHEIKDKNSQVQMDKTEKLMLDTLNIIEKEFTNSSLSLEYVSDQLNISVSYLSMLLKKHKNISFNKYLIQVRMEKAQELLRYTDDKIITISQKVGYNEVYYFSHSFKKFTSYSPREYREIHKKTE